MNKEKLESQIQEIESQIEKLEVKKSKLTKKLFDTPMSKGEQLQNVLRYGGEDRWIIQRTRDGILDKYCSGHGRYEIVHLGYLLERIEELSVLTYNFEDQKKVFELFGIDSELTQEGFNDALEYEYNDIFDFSEFEDLWNDIVKAGVSSFKFDW